MKLLCCTCMHERPKVSEIFLSNMKRLGIDVVAVVSEGDNATAAICEVYDTPYLFYDNLPLGAKWNKAMEIASTMLGYTHLMLCGDDDILSPELVPLIEEYQDNPFLGIESTYMIEPRSKKAQVMRYNKKVKIAMGSGKVIHMDLAKEVVKRGGMFDPQANSKLDGYADIILLGIGNYRPVILDIDKTLMCGIKTDKNIWSFDNFNYLAKEVDYSEALSVFGNDELELLSYYDHDRNVNVH